MDRKRKQNVAALFGGALTAALEPTILLSANTPLESLAVDGVIGLLSVVRGTGSYTFTLTTNPGSRYKIANGNELQVASALDHEANPIDQIVIEADNTVDPVIDKPFFIFVQNVVENPVFTAPPVISGVAETGATLAMSSPGTLESPDGDAATRAYQWVVVGTPDTEIEGETDETNFVPDVSLNGESVRLREDATNSAGTTSEVSNAIGPLALAVEPESLIQFDREAVTALQFGML